jgi:hypothetical protein
VYIFCRVCQKALPHERVKRFRKRKYKNAYCSNECYRYHRAQIMHMRRVVMPEWEAMKAAVNARIYRELKEWWDSGGCYWSMKNYFLKLDEKFWKNAPNDVKALIRAAARIAKLPTAARRVIARRQVRESAIEMFDRPAPTREPRDTLSTEKDIENEMRAAECSQGDPT